MPSVTFDVDSAPIEVHGHQPKAEWNGHYNDRTITIRVPRAERACNISGHRSSSARIKISDRQWLRNAFTATLRSIGEQILMNIPCGQASACQAIRARSGVSDQKEREIRLLMSNSIYQGYHGICLADPKGMNPDQCTKWSR